MKKRTCSPSTPKCLSKRKAAIARFFTRPWYGVESASATARDERRVGAAQKCAWLEQVLDHLERDDDVPGRRLDGPGKLFDRVPPDVNARMARLGALDGRCRDLEPGCLDTASAGFGNETAVARTAVEEPRSVRRGAMPPETRGTRAASQ